MDVTGAVFLENVGLWLFGGGAFITNESVNVLCLNLGYNTRLCSVDFHHQTCFGFTKQAPLTSLEHYLNIRFSKKALKNLSCFTNVIICMCFASLGERALSISTVL